MTENELTQEQREAEAAKAKQEAEKAAAKAAAKAEKEAEAERAKLEAEKPKTVRMILPLIPGGDKVVEVGINGKYTLIKRGEVVDVPLDVAEVLAHSSAAEMQYQEIEKAIKNIPD